MTHEKTYPQPLRLLTAQEERELALRIQNGDLEARNTLVNHNFGLIKWTIRHYKLEPYRSLDSDDMWQNGVCGLIKAAERYNPDQGRFSTYAKNWIRQSICRAMVDTARTIRFPAEVDAMRYKILAAERQLEKDCKPITEQAIAELSGLSKTDLKRSTGLPDTTSMFTPYMKSGVMETPEFAEECQDLEALFDTSAQDSENLHKMLEALAPMEREVLELRFGLHPAGPLGLVDTSKRLGVSRQTVRNYQQKALKKLRNMAPFFDLEP